MPYLIDGHNLIGQLPDISLDDPNDEALLVQKLTGYAARTGQRMTVYFDGGLPGGASRMSTRMVRVEFASAPGIADRMIINRIAKIRDPGNWTVVSSDRAVLHVARQTGMRTLRSSDFARELNAPPARPTVEAEKPPDRPLSPDEIEEWLRLFSRKK